jgi:HEPN domain-containing protein
MNQEKYRHEARRWLITAREDLEAAELLFEKGKYSHACFLAQQASEKMLKSLWYWFGEEPWGHSLQRLTQDFPVPEIREKLIPFVQLAAQLDRYYVPTRYPNGLPDLTPGQNYFRQDGEQALKAAHSLLQFTEKYFQ